MATETIIQREAPEIEAYKLGLMKQAQDLVKAPPKGGLPDIRSAQETNMQQQAQLLARQGVGTFQPFIDQAAGTIGTGLGAFGTGAGAIQAGLGNIYAAAGQDPTADARKMVTGSAQAYDPTTGAAAYMNPYQQAVADEINRAYDIQQRQAAGQAVGAGAFGGSRAEIAAREIDRNRASALAKAQADNFLQAQQAARADFSNQQARQMQAGQTLGQLGLTQQDALRQAGVSAGQLGASLGQLGQGIGSLGVQQAALGELGSKLTGEDINRLATLGEQQRQINQAELEAARQTKMQTVFEPYQRLGFYSDILRGAPTTQQTITQSATANPSLLNQIVGGAATGLGLYGAANKTGLI